MRSDADDFGQRRARNAPRRACDAGWSLLEFARRGACDGASLLLEAGFVPAAVAAYHRAVSVALGGAADAPLTAGRIDAFMLAQSCADALERVSYCTDPFSGNAHALGTSRDAVCGEYASLGILGPISAVFAASGDSPQLASLREATFRLLSTFFMGISDRSLVDASLVTALGACLGGGDEKAAASAVCALNSLVDLTGRASGQDLTDAALQAFCTPEMVGAIVDMLARGHGVPCGQIIQLLAKSTPHARAFATRRVVGALRRLEVVRADRAREILMALGAPDFDGFDRGARPSLSARLGMVDYSTAHDGFMTTAYPKQEIRNTLGEWVAKKGLRQFRLAETEKYPHVTFFLNGGKEEPEEGEDRFMPKSPKVATYDLQPEMSEPEVADRFVAAIESGELAVGEVTPPLVPVALRRSRELRTAQPD